SRNDGERQSALERHDGRNRPAIQPETSKTVVSLVIVRLPDDGGRAHMGPIVIGALLLQPDIVVVLRHGAGTVADVAGRLQRRGAQALAPDIESDHADTVAETFFDSNL